MPTVTSKTPLPRSRCTKSVDRAATEVDLLVAFKDHDIELTETDEKAVVAKIARVVKEVRVRTEATDRAQTVRDTVRKTEIDVEKTDDNSSPKRGSAASVKLGESGAGSPRGTAGGGLTASSACQSSAGVGWTASL